LLYPAPMETLTLAASVCLAVVVACWLLSVITREYSWTDRAWSTVPPVYTWIFAWESGWNPRVVLMAALVTAWGARLTFNFWRKGGFARGGEDYRWAVLQGMMPGWAWALFNIAFVAVYQNVLVFLITLPAWRVAGASRPLGALDVLLTALFLAALLGETVADQQQWNFQQAKRARTARGEPGPDFLTTGLFAWSRHPNFFFEQAQWWVLTLFLVAAGVSWLDLTLGGAVLLTLLFDGSTRFTEWISARRYPAYAAYQQTTSRLVPWPPAVRAPAETSAG
jgi:steroid 5-alpha reductase family enzyme